MRAPASVMIMGIVLGLTAAAPASRPGHKVAAKTSLYEFSYAYPAAAAAIPAVRALLDRDAARAKATLVREARDGAADARQNKYPYRGYSADTTWQLVTNLPGWLSLSATNYTYSGGAHGNTGFDTLLWDKRARVRRAPITLFVSAAAFHDALARPLCDALDRERLKRRGEVWTDKLFTGCVDPVKEATLILGSSDGRRFNRIGFLIGPYVAGPYAEGPYEITVPVTPAILAIVRAQHLAAFRVQ